LSGSSSIEVNSQESGAVAKIVLVVVVVLECLEIPEDDDEYDDENGVESGGVI